MREVVRISVEWSPGLRRDGEHHAVTVHVRAGGWYPHSPATWEQPAEGGFYEDIDLLTAEIEGEPALTDYEMALVRAWFDTTEASDAVHRASMAAGAKVRDPDQARDDAWDRAQMAEQEPF